MTEQLGFLDEIPYIKNNLLLKLLSDEYLMKLVSDSYDVQIPALDLRFKQVYPWEDTIGTTEESKAFITFEMRGESIKDYSGKHRTDTKRVYLYVYCFCHEAINLVDDMVADRLGLPDDKRGSRIDLMAARVDRLINGSVFSNWGRFQFDDQAILTPVGVNHHGKCNVYIAEIANQYGDKMYEHSDMPFEVNLYA